MQNSWRKCRAALTRPTTTSAEILNPGSRACARDDISHLAEHCHAGIQSITDPGSRALARDDISHLAEHCHAGECPE